MPKKTHLRVADIHGLTSLAVDGALAVTDQVEALHQAILTSPNYFCPPLTVTPPYILTQGITKLIYQTIRRITRLVRLSNDRLFAPLVPLFKTEHSSFERETVLGALNGVLGDHLVNTGNPLAIPLQLRRDGQALDLTKAGLAAALPQASGKILLLVHGLCMNDLLWHWQGHNHGVALDMELGYTPVYLHYNSGLHISTNGQAFAALLEQLVNLWPTPVEELVIIGHSMGGLVTRSACHYGAQAGHAWLRPLRKIIFLGTPHQGAPLEQIGHWVSLLLSRSSYTAILAQLGKLRSAGITDLRYGFLHDEDWHGQDRFAHAPDPRQPPAFLDGVQYYTIAATTGQTSGDLKDELFGDGLVPLHSALGDHVYQHKALPFSPDHQWVGYGMNHLDLLHRPDVYAQMRTWLLEN